MKCKILSLVFQLDNLNNTTKMPFYTFLFITLQSTYKKQMLSIIDLILLSIGVAMDAFAVSIAKGLSARRVTTANYFCVGAWFGGFQALMPLIGFFAGVHFAHTVQSFDHWIAFVLLSFIGGKMLKDALSKDEEGTIKADFSFRNMLLLAIATSIDALAVGISLAFLMVNIWLAIALMGLVTFAFSAAGLKIGKIFGNRYKKTAEIAGGIILIFIGIKILFTHL